MLASSRRSRVKWVMARFMKWKVCQQTTQYHSPWEDLKLYGLLAKKPESLPDLLASSHYSHTMQIITSLHCQFRDDRTSQGHIDPCWLFANTTMYHSFCAFFARFDDASSISVRPQQLTFQGNRVLIAEQSRADRGLISLVCYETNEDQAHPFQPRMGVVTGTK